MEKKGKINSSDVLEIIKIIVIVIIGYIIIKALLSAAWVSYSLSNHPEGNAGGWGIEFPRPAIGEESPVSKK